VPFCARPDGVVELHDVAELGVLGHICRSAATIRGRRGFWLSGNQRWVSVVGWAARDDRYGHCATSWTHHSCLQLVVQTERPVSLRLL
jgi:hypothetical protein